jgi:hypothetical protein
LIGGAFEDPLAVELEMPSDKAFGRSIAWLSIYGAFGVAITGGLPLEECRGFILAYGTMALGWFTFRRPFLAAAVTWTLAALLGELVIKTHVCVYGSLSAFPFVASGAVWVANVRRWRRGMAARRQILRESQLALYATATQPAPVLPVEADRRTT